MKKTKAKPSGPVEDTVFYRFLSEEGVGVYMREGNNPMMPNQVIVRPIARINTNKPNELWNDSSCRGEISIPASGMVRCSPAYVYGWIAMQKNLIEFRKGKKKA